MQKAISKEEMRLKDKKEKYRKEKNNNLYRRSNWAASAFIGGVCTLGTTYWLISRWDHTSQILTGTCALFSGFALWQAAKYNKLSEKGFSQQKKDYMSVLSVLSKDIAARLRVLCNEGGEEK